MSAHNVIKELEAADAKGYDTTLSMPATNVTFLGVTTDAFVVTSGDGMNGAGVLTSSGIADDGGITSSGVIKSSSPTGGVGYITGAGGTVTQITNIDTGVTLNKICGEIILVTSATLAAAAEASITVTNSAVAVTDVVVVSVKTQYTDGVIVAYVKSVAAGSFVIGLTNVDAAAVSAGTGKLSFAVIKAVLA